MKRLAALAAFLVFSVSVARAQDPVPDAVAAAPQAFKEKLNNDKVRVLEYSSKPGAKEAMHSHGPTLIYVITGGKNRHTLPNGDTKDMEYKTGDVLWRDGMVHSVENTGKTEIKMLLVETKEPAKEQPAAK